MNKDVFKLAEGYVTSSYIRQGAEAYHMREKMVKTLFSQVCVIEYSFVVRYMCVGLEENAV